MRFALTKNAEPGTLISYRTFDGACFAGRLLETRSTIKGNYVDVQWLHTGAKGTCELSRVSRLIVTFAGPLEKDVVLRPK